MFITSVALDTVTEDNYLRHLPLVRHLEAQGRLRFTTPVTCFVGDNGSGKSTLVESIARAMGFSPAGGPIRDRDFQLRSRDTGPTLAPWLTVRGQETPLRGYFLRADTHYDSVSIFDGQEWATERRQEMSHGESVLSILGEQMDGAGLYIFDEPESGLSVVRQMALVAEIHQAVERGGQFIIATHSPIILAVPNARIIEISPEGLTEMVYEEAEAVVATREFLEDPQAMIRYLLS